MGGGYLVLSAVIGLLISLYYLIFKKDVMFGEHAQLYKIMVYGLTIAASVILLWSGISYLISIQTD